MTLSKPAPKPALRKAPDGTVHPASARSSLLAVDAEAVRTAAKASSKERKERKGSSKSKARPGDERVELAITMPKAVRKRLRQKASAQGWSAEEAAAHVLRAWADE